MQGVNWKVVGILAGMLTVGALSTNWPSWAQSPAEPGRQETKPKYDAQAELQRAAEELAKIQHQIDFYKAVYASKAANLAAAKKAIEQQPKTIEQRLGEIENKLDTILAALATKGGAALYWAPGSELKPPPVSYMQSGDAYAPPPTCLAPPPPGMAPPPPPVKDKMIP